MKWTVALAISFICNALWFAVYTSSVNHTNPTVTYYVDYKAQLCFVSTPTAFETIPCNDYIISKGESLK